MGLIDGTNIVSVMQVVVLRILLFHIRHRCGIRWIIPWRHLCNDPHYLFISTYT